MRRGLLSHRQMAPALVSEAERVEAFDLVHVAKGMRSDAGLILDTGFESEYLMDLFLKY